MRYEDALRRLAINDLEMVDDLRIAASPMCDSGIDARTQALTRVGALVAVGGTVHSFGVEVTSALEAGATPDQIVDVLLAVAPVVGSAATVAAAPVLALALGYDIDGALESRHRPPAR